MSYLRSPRLHFSGRFQADPSTVNNDPEHFDTSRFQSNYDLPGAGSSNGWWNPGGTANWRFFECSVQRVVYEDGTICDDPALDPVVGSPVGSGGGRTEGKLVDLDPEQQMVSEVWGFQVTLGGGLNGFSIRGDFEVAAFSDIWVRYAQGHPDSFFGAFYQSVLQNLAWDNRTDRASSKSWSSSLEARPRNENSASSSTSTVMTATARRRHSPSAAWWDRSVCMFPASPFILSPGAP